MFSEPVRVLWCEPAWGCSASGLIVRLGELLELNLVISRLPGGKPWGGGRQGSALLGFGVEGSQSAEREAQRSAAEKPHGLSSARGGKNRRPKNSPGRRRSKATRSVGVAVQSEEVLGPVRLGGLLPAAAKPGRRSSTARPRGSIPRGPT